MAYPGWTAIEAVEQAALRGDDGRRSRLVWRHVDAVIVGHFTWRRCVWTPHRQRRQRRLFHLQINRTYKP